MAVVPLYFSTSSAGTGLGNDWANRAALFTAGNWSAVLTAFNFGGSDSVVAYIGPGSYSCGQVLANATFSVAAPTAANPLVLHACDSSGVQLAPPDPDWTADTPVWDLTNVGVIATTGNIATITSDNTHLRLLKFTASGRNGIVIANTGALDFVVVASSTSNTTTIPISGPTRLTNTVIQLTGTAYDRGFNLVAGIFDNIRIEGNASASSGSRRGVVAAASNLAASRICAFGHVGGAAVSGSASAGHSFSLTKCTLPNNGGTAILGHNTASQTGLNVFARCMLTGSGAYGINADASRFVVEQCRLRDNTSGNFNGFGNYPTDLGNYTTASTDSAEYVNAGAGDYRIKNTATIWGMGFGVSDEPASGGGGGQRSYAF